MLTRFVFFRHCKEQRKFLSLNFRFCFVVIVVYLAYDAGRENSVEGVCGFWRSLSVGQSGCLSEGVDGPITHYPPLCRGNESKLNEKRLKCFINNNRFF